MIKEIATKEEIRDALEHFTPYLHTLSSGSVDKDVLADKYHKCARVIGLYEQESLAGFGGVYCNNLQSRTAFLSLIAVHPSYQRKGYGGLLLSEVIRISKDEGMEQLELEVRRQNTAGICFYQKQGFCFLEKETEDSVFMGLQLGRK